jgi:hypothetical protein
MTGLAHAGGVDEAAMIVLPLLLFAVFLLLERRARRRERDAEPDEPADPDAS